MAVFNDRILLQRDLVLVMAALADEIRLRILAALSGEPLSVQEIQEILALKQSRTSRHLQILARVGLVEGVRDGSRVYYGLHQDIRRSSELSGLLAAAGIAGPSGEALRIADGEAAAPRLRRPAAMTEDRDRLQAVLAERRRDAIEHFQQHGQEQDRLQSGLVDSNFYRRQVLAMLPEDAGLTLDLGCGAGELARLLATRAPRLICVDQSPNMIEHAERRVADPNAEFRIGALEHLPVKDGEIDTVVASMVLHHMPDPASALREIRRALRPGGCLVLAELDRHDVEAMRANFGDFWLGFPQARMHRALEEAGFSVERQASGEGVGQLKCIFFLARRTKTTRAIEPAAQRARRSRPPARALMN